MVKHQRGRWRVVRTVGIEGFKVDVNGGWAETDEAEVGGGDDGIGHRSFHTVWANCFGYFRATDGTGCTGD